MNTKTFLLNKKVPPTLTAISLAMLVGCKPAAPGAANTAPQPVQAAPAPVVVEPAPVPVEADYVYYPGYEVYYSPVTHVYWYMQGGGWVSGPVVPGISVDVLLGSPSVRTDFHDSPANHHAEVVRQYPRDWKRPDGH